MLNILTGIHGQTPVSALTELQYEAAAIELANQMEAQMALEVGENEQHMSQCDDALANSFTPDMTVYEWMVAACKSVDIDAGALACV